MKYSYALLALLALIMNACGGGGGGSSTPASTSGSSTSSVGASSVSSSAATSSSSASSAAQSSAASTSSAASASSASSAANSSSSAAGAVLTGVFIDSAVQNLTYRTATTSGVTDAQGAFTYRAGEAITFSLYDTQLDATKAAAYLSPGDLKDLPNPHYTLNLIRVLLAADADGNPDNGIQLVPASPGEKWVFNLDQSIRAFDQDATFKAFVAAHSVSKVAPTFEAATSHFNSTVHGVLRKQSGVEGVFPVVGRTMSYSVKSDFCADPSAWYGNAKVTLLKTGYKVAGGWSNLTNVLNATSNGVTLEPTAGMSCGTLGNAVASSSTEYGYGMFSSPGVIAYKKVGNNTFENMLNDVSDWNYTDLNGNRGIIWPQYEFGGGTDTYGRAYIDMYWRRDTTLWRVRSYYAAGTNATHGAELGSISERYVFQ